MIASICMHMIVLCWTISCNLGHCGLLSLSITNPEVFRHRAVNQQVYVTIAINDESKVGQHVELSSEDIENIAVASRVCLHLDGKPCHCIHTNKTNPISKATLVTSHDCMHSTKGFWSSIRYLRAFTYTLYFIFSFFVCFFLSFFLSFLYDDLQLHFKF